MLLSSAAAKDSKRERFRLGRQPTSCEVRRDLVIAARSAGGLVSPYGLHVERTLGGQTVPLEEIRRVGKEGNAPPTQQGIPVSLVVRPGSRRVPGR